MSFHPSIHLSVEIFRFCALIQKLLDLGTCTFALGRWRCPFVFGSLGSEVIVARELCLKIVLSSNTESSFFGRSFWVYSSPLVIAIVSYAKLLYHQKRNLVGFTGVTLSVCLSVRPCIRKCCPEHNFKSIKASNFKLHTQIGHKFYMGLYRENFRNLPVHSHKA